MAQLNSKHKNANIFKWFCSELTRDLSKKNYQTSEEVIKKILPRLSTSKAAGVDHIPAKFLKDSAKVLALLMWNIINLSIKISTFPEESKIVKLKPIFKKGTRTDPKICQPISILRLVSKIIEKSIRFQIEDYLNKKKLIYMYQSDFRRNYSTDSFLAQLTDFVLTSIDKQVTYQRDISRSSECVWYFRSWSSSGKNEIFWFPGICN